MPARRKQRKTESREPEPVALPPRPAKALPVIKVVGISASGKSTLVRSLRAAGYDARPVSQEHSNIPDLWQHFDEPDYLIYLHASLEDQRARRPDVMWSAGAHKEEMRRLAHAREHADLRIDTSGMTPGSVYQIASSFLTQQRVRHADHPLQPVPATGSAKPPD